MRLSRVHVTVRKLRWKNNICERNMILAKATCAKNNNIEIPKVTFFLVQSNPGRFGPGSFRPGSFQPNLGVGRFGLGRWVDSALGHFGPVSFRPKSLPKCRLLRTGTQTKQ